MFGMFLMSCCNNIQTQNRMLNTTSSFYMKYNLQDTKDICFQQRHSRTYIHMLGNHCLMCIYSNDRCNFGTIRIGWYNMIIRKKHILFHLSKPNSFIGNLCKVHFPNTSFTCRSYSCPDFDKENILVHISNNPAFLDSKNIHRRIVSRLSLSHHTLHKIRCKEIHRHKCWVFHQVWIHLCSPYKLSGFNIPNRPNCSSQPPQCTLYNCSGHFDTIDNVPCMMEIWFDWTQASHFYLMTCGQIREK